MATTIKCNKCQNQIEITQAIREELETKILAEQEKKYHQEIDKLKHEKDKLISDKEKELEDQKKHILETSRKEAIEKVRQEYDIKIQSTKEESLEREKQVKDLQLQLKDVLKQFRDMKNEKDNLDIQFQKKLLEEQDNIKSKAKVEAQEEFGLKLAEKEKQLADTKKQLLDAQRKIDQGSQQLQGEIFELNLEKILKEHFPQDIIEPVEKGRKGADIRQTVRSPKGSICGVILWEAKNTKTWSNDWIEKLKDDLRSEGANIPVIITSVLPKHFENDLGIMDGVWITTFSLVIPLAMLFRKNLLDVGYQKAVIKHQESKAEQLYQYITSHEFKQQVEAMIDIYQQMKNQIHKEKVAFEKAWTMRDKQIDKLLSATSNVIGSIQGEVGQSVLHIKGLDFLEIPHEESTRSLL